MGSLNRKQKGGQQPWASVLCRQSTGRFSLCFFVNSSAFFMNFARSLLYSSARSALSGCSGWGEFTRSMRFLITGGERERECVWFFFFFRWKAALSYSWYPWNDTQLWKKTKQTTLGITNSREETFCASPESLSAFTKTRASRLWGLSRFWWLA